jgi:tetratricopeptide (TPR) repeat protein
MALLMTAGCLAVAACLGGCTPTLTPEARALFESGRAAHRAGEPELTIQRMDEFLAANGRSREAAEGYMLRGQAFSRLGRLDQAVDDLSKAAEDAETPDLRAGANIALGDALFSGGDWQAAELAYGQALGDIERGTRPSDYAHYRLGVTLQRMGRFGEADPHLDRVIFYFGDGGYAAEAARRTHATAWTLREGLYDDRAAAEMRREQLTAAGVDGVEVLAVLEDELKFAVQAGRFGTWQEAAAALEAVGQAAPDARIVVAR